MGSSLLKCSETIAGHNYSEAAAYASHEPFVGESLVIPEVSIMFQMVPVRRLLRHSSVALQHRPGLFSSVSQGGRETSLDSTRSHVAFCAQGAWPRIKGEVLEAG